MRSDHELTAELASQAGQRLLVLRDSNREPSELRKAGDRSSHEFLTGELARLPPGDWVLSEEGSAVDLSRMMVAAMQQLRRVPPPPQLPPLQPN